MKVWSDSKGLYTEVAEIDISFPNSKYKSLLRKLKVDEGKKFTEKQVQLIFVNSIHLFLLGKLSQDELSTIANKFWSSKKVKFDELGSVLYKCAELIFSVRRIYVPKRPKVYGNLTSFMKTVMKYYEKYIDKVFLVQKNNSS